MKSFIYKRLNGSMAYDNIKAYIQYQLTPPLPRGLAGVVVSYGAADWGNEDEDEVENQINRTHKIWIEYVRQQHGKIWAIFGGNFDITDEFKMLRCTLSYIHQWMYIIKQGIVLIVIDYVYYDQHPPPLHERF